MTNFESQQFRKKLAKDIKETIKEKRKEVLEKTKETPEYWESRENKIKERQREEEIDNGFGVLIKNKILYHGSGISEINTFLNAEESTIGEGVYLTSEAKSAIGYAKIRSEGKRYHIKKGNSDEDFKPVIYECLVKDIKLCDLRKNENVKKVLEKFLQILEEEAKKPHLNWQVRENITQAIEAIKKEKITMNNLKRITQNNGELFNKCIKSLGYEGLIAFEGGEGDIGNHETYLIFDPQKVKIIDKHKIDLKNTIQSREEKIRKIYNESYLKHELNAIKIGKIENPPRKEVVEFVEKYKNELGSKILDVGCGAGGNLLYLAKQGLEVTGIDISDKGVELTKKQLELEGLKGNVIVGDIKQLPFPESAFDSAISIRVLDYNNTDGAFTKLKEIARVIKKGGIFFLTVRSVNQPQKTDEELIEENEWQGKTYKKLGSGEENEVFYHYFSEKEIKNLSEKAGFTVETMQEIIKYDEKEKRQKAKWLVVLRKRSL